MYPGKDNRYAHSHRSHGYFLSTGAASNLVFAVCPSCEPQTGRKSRNFQRFTPHILLVIPVSVVCPDSGRAGMIFYHKVNKPGPKYDKI